MNFAPRTLSSSLLVLALAACGDSGSPISGTGITDPLPPSPTTDSEPSTEGTTEEPEQPEQPEQPTTSTTDADPCDSCDDNASCVGGQCVCDDGFKGDGQTCADIDECAGKNDCDVDATCTNTPGGYECACKEGYKGNGYNCSDVDECTEDLDQCDANATCTNQDGSYKCACKEGFTGDGFTCNGSKQFGETCDFSSECASGICLGAGYDQCTITCSQNVANGCGAQGVPGLCIQADVNLYLCVGDLTFGSDPDDEVMQPGDKVTRFFQTTTDADVFLVQISFAGKYIISATPDPDDDVKLEFYNADASSFGVLDSAGMGGTEAAEITTQPGVFFVVARNVGIGSGSYSIEVQPG